MRNELTRELDELTSKVASGAVGAVDGKSAATIEDGTLKPSKSAQLLELVTANGKLMADLDSLRQEISAAKDVADKARVEAEQAAASAKRAETSAGCKCVIM